VEPSSPFDTSIKVLKASFIWGIWVITRMHSKSGAIALMAMTKRSQTN
jgi:hypothetical protein